MDDQKDLQQTPQPQRTVSAPGAHRTEQEEKENVVSVWHGSGNTAFFRRRYFDGFTQYETLDENGKLERHNVYTGTWYTQDLTREARIRTRCIYVLLWLAGAALLLLGCTRSVAVNMTLLSALPAFVGLFGFGWIAVGLFNEFTVPVRRTVGEYRASSKSIQRGALMAGAAAAVCGLVTLGWAIFVRAQIGTHLLIAGGELASAAAAFVLRALERRVRYLETRSADAGKYTM